MEEEGEIESMVAVLLARWPGMLRLRLAVCAWVLVVVLAVVLVVVLAVARVLREEEDDERDGVVVVAVEVGVVVEEEREMGCVDAQDPSRTSSQPPPPAPRHCRSHASLQVNLSPPQPALALPAQPWAFSLRSTSSSSCAAPRLPLVLASSAVTASSRLVSSCMCARSSASRSQCRPCGSVDMVEVVEVEVVEVAGEQHRDGSGEEDLLLLDFAANVHVCACA